MQKYRDRKYPFIYISALTRTGSTVLSEMLTQVPYAFIFREPHIGKNYFAVERYDIKVFKSCGIDLERFIKYRLPIAFFLRRLRVFGYRQDYMVQTFQQYLLPRLYQHIMQIGVKEISHQGWGNYVRHFPEMKVIMMGRDPRDIFLSSYKRLEIKGVNSENNLSPDKLSAKLNEQFEMQLELRDNTDCLVVRYEDICLDQSIFEIIKKFVDSPIPSIGQIGQFNIHHPIRIYEYQLHGDKLSSKSVQRWKREPDLELVEEAHQVFESMPEYTNFWGYNLG